MASAKASDGGGLPSGEVEDEVTYTDDQWAALEVAQNFVLTKYRGRLACGIVSGDFVLRPILSVRWEGHSANPKARPGENVLSTGERPRPPVHTSFAAYHRKAFTRKPEGQQHDTDEDGVYLDAEAHPEYESSNGGTVTCEGYGLDCWEHDLYFAGKNRQDTFIVYGGPVPSVSGTSLMRRLDELRSSTQRFGLDPSKDYKDLVEFAGDFASGHFDPNMKFELREQESHLRRLLNRRDLFSDPTEQISVCQAFLGNSPSDLGVWNFLWQVILGKELGRRLAIGDGGWSSNDFTRKISATLTVADQWIQNVQTVKQLKGPEGRAQTKQTFQETSAQYKAQLVINSEAEGLKTRGNEALTAKSPGHAVRLYTRALQLSPNNAVYLTNRSNANFRQNKLISAEKDAQAAVDADPMYAKGWSWLGAALFEQGKYEASAEAYEWAVELDGSGGTVPMKEGLAKARSKVTEIKGVDVAQLEKLVEPQPDGSTNEWGNANLKFQSQVHVQQKEALCLFAEKMSWPYLDEVRKHARDVYTNMHKGTGISLQAWDFLYGLSLPGRWFSLKIAHALVECSPSLKDVEPSPYYDAGISLETVSYWRVRSVLGRVLGGLSKNVKSLCGWVGPCPPVEGTGVRFVRLKTDRVEPKNRDVNDEKTLQYKVDWDKESVVPRPGENVEDVVRQLQDESHWSVPSPPQWNKSYYRMGKITATLDGTGEEEPHRAYRPSVSFIMNDNSVEPLQFQLKANPTFVTLPPCYNATKEGHPVHRRELPRYQRNIWALPDLLNAQPKDYESQSVIVINATGPGAETVARAWCASVGKNAGIRRPHGPCYVCAYNAVSISGLYLEVLIWVAEAREFKSEQAPQVKVPQSPCPVCSDLSLGGGDGRPAHRFRTTLEDVEASSNRGCSGCEILQRGIGLCDKSEPTTEIPSGPPKATISGHLINQLDGYAAFGSLPKPGDQFQSSRRVINGTCERGCGLCITHIYRTWQMPDGGVAEIDIFVEEVTGSEAPWKNLPLSTGISGDTSSIRSLRRAREWLANCSNNHGACKILKSSRLPDRVLDVGVSSNYNDWRVELALVETSTLETPARNAPYVCLSHCWGGSSPITTTKSTLALHKAGITRQELPKTFEDAVSITRYLGIRYLWIDSLCIVQDDPSDWFVQSAKMPDIYENAYVTIAATHSSSSSGGCFSKANPMYRAKSFRVRDARTGKSHDVSARRHLPHWLRCDPTFAVEDAADLTALSLPLLTRAWVLQERLLSPRVLHFTAHEVAFECQEAAACECGFLDRVPADRLAKVAHRRNLPHAKPGGDRQRQIAMWHALVRSYSRLAMTLKSDKLQALSGLARQVARALDAGGSGASYAAGLWLGSFIADMLWETHEPRPRLVEWRAPSWSWAAVSSPVLYYAPHTLGSGGAVLAYAEALDVRAIRAGLDELGQLEEASMRVKALFMVANLVVYTAEREGDPVPERARPQLVVDGTLFNPPTDTDAQLQPAPNVVLLDYAMAPTTASTAFRGYGTAEVGKQVLVMRLARVAGCEFSLILACMNHEKDLYERVGIAKEFVPVGQERVLRWSGPGAFWSMVTLM